MNLNFKTVNFMIKLESIRKQNGDYKEAICDDPKILSIFNSNFYKDQLASLNFELEEFCQDRTAVVSSKDLADKIFSEVNYANVIQVFQKFVASIPNDIKNLTLLANQLSQLNIQQISLGSPNDLLTGFNTINAALTFLDQSLTDTSKLNLYK